jgi:protein-disulfide isomerase
MAGAWALAARAWPRSLAWVARAGAVASLGFLGAAAWLAAPCPFCLAAQAASLVFTWASERRVSRQRLPRAEIAFLLGGMLVVAGLLARGRQLEQQRSTDAEAELGAALEGALDEAQGFTGRHRIGPERAPLRLVLFLDYGCPDCRRIDGEALALVRGRDDLSLSIKHFPLDDDCNRRARRLGRDPHPGACLAARAAEAAALAGGDDAFWSLHTWLMGRDRLPQQEELEQAPEALGIPPGAFREALLGQEAEARVAADVEEGLALGVESTPALFLNGVELREWRAPGALSRALASLAARAPATAGPGADRPPSALERALGDWRREPQRELPTRAGLPARAGFELVLWGDYLDEPTRALLVSLRASLASRPEARLVFRHYPLDATCVPDAPALHPGACRLARQAEAARLTGGEEALARFEAWVLAREAGAKLETLAAAQAAGVPPAEFAELATAPATLAAITLDVDAARKLGVQTLPLLFIDGKRVPRWRLDGEGDVLAAILAECPQR